MAVRPTPSFAAAGEIPEPQGFAGTTAPHGPVSLLEVSPVRTGYHMPSSGSAQATRQRMLAELDQAEERAAARSTLRRNLSLVFARIPAERVSAVAQGAVNQSGERQASDASRLRSRASSERA